MNTLNKCLIAGIAAMGLSAASLGTSAIAASTDNSYDGCPMYMDGSGSANAYAGHSNRGDHMKRWHQYRQQRQTALHDKLKLNADQEKAWKNYLSVIDTNDNSFKPLSRAEMGKMTAPQRMETMLNHMKERQDKMAGNLSALKTFYNQLTPEQQKTFDSESFSHRGYHRGGGYGHRGASNLK